MSLGGSDPDAGDQLLYDWDLGDGTLGSGATPPTSHAYADNPTAPATAYTITLTVRDGKGAIDRKTTTVSVQNAPPVVAGITAPSVIDEGGTITFSASGVTDPSSKDTQQGFTYDFACSSDPFDGTFTSANSATCAAVDGPGTVTVRVMAKDKDGARSAEKQVGVTVDNVRPIVGAFTGLPANLAPVPVGAGGTFSVTIGAPFTDPGTDDTHVGSVEWDAGTGFSPADAIAKGVRTITGTKALSAGVYTISLRVTDDDGGVDQQAAPGYVVVYDPSGGFVTGGGWVLSPNGACDATLCTTFTGEGKASFGFVSKYSKGATQPTGNTEFQFEAGGLSFKSTRYDWLVVAGAKAQYKGYGSINGSAEKYGFLLTAFDGALDRSNPTDRFRIKIWDTTTGVVVYDNRRGNADDSDATQAIGAGSIVIHTR